jgi:hypothetical protein
MSRPTEPTSPSSAAGSCLCGAVRFTVELPTTFCAHCHCTICQRNHGAAFVTWFAVPKGQFHLLTDEAVLTRHASSEHGRRAFCSRCGTPLFCELDRYPDTIDVTLASMQEPIDRTPEAHVYFDTHVAWLETLERLPKIDVG